jgi:hypothetical protein
VELHFWAILARYCWDWRAVGQLKDVLQKDQRGRRLDGWPWSSSRPLAVAGGQGRAGGGHDLYCDGSLERRSTTAALPEVASLRATVNSANRARTLEYPCRLLGIKSVSRRGLCFIKYKLCLVFEEKHNHYRKRSYIDSVWLWKTMLYLLVRGFFP